MVCGRKNRAYLHNSTVTHCKRHHNSTTVHVHPVQCASSNSVGALWQFPIPTPKNLSHVFFCCLDFIRLGSPALMYSPPPPGTLADYFTNLNIADLTQNLSIAPPPIMTTPTPKELRINTPSTFDGTSSKAQRWLDSVQMYIYLNRELYDTDEKQVIFALSFMTENSARV